MPRQLSDGVWQIDLTGVNAYLVADDVLTLIDAGLPWSGNAIETAIREVGFEPETVERVLVTHFDLDHVGALASLSGTQDIYVGEADADFVSGKQTPGFTGLKRGLMRLSTVILHPPQTPITPVRDGDEIGTFTAIHSPGHTPGHVAYVSEARDVAFVGDLVTSDGESLSPPPWYLNDDNPTIEFSIERLAERLPPVDVVASGHGEPLVGEAYRAVHTMSARQSVTGDTA